MYQIAPASGLLNDYKTSNATSSLNISSKLVTATCQSGMTTASPLSGSTVEACGTCAGLVAKGGQGTYYAGAINAAQQALTANSQPGVQNVIILLSDGGAGNGTTLGSVETSAETPARQSHPAFRFWCRPPSSLAPPLPILPRPPGIPTRSRPGTTVVSTSGTTVTISNHVVAVRYVLQPTRPRRPAAYTLNFAAVAAQGSGGSVPLLPDHWYQRPRRNPGRDHRLGTRRVSPFPSVPGTVTISTQCRWI